MMCFGDLTLLLFKNISIPSVYLFINIFVIIYILFLQVMVTNVTSLLKTVKAVEDEATRGTRALEATIECIKQEMAVRVKDAYEWMWVKVM